MAVPDTYLQAPEGPTEVTGPGILRNDSVPCGSAVQVSLVTPPRNGELTALGDDGSFSYQPAMPAQADSFTYEITCPDTGLVSGGGDSATYV